MRKRQYFGGWVIACGFRPQQLDFCGLKPGYSLQRPLSGLERQVSPSVLTFRFG